MFVDTSALTWRYVRGTSTEAIDKCLAGAPTVVISEWVLVEWSSGLAREFRMGNITASDFKANELALMTDVADGRLVVIPTTTSTERIRALIEYVGVRKGRGLKAGDATQVITAMEATASLGRIRFVCCDKQLASIMQEIEPMSSIFETVYFEP